MRVLVTGGSRGLGRSIVEACLHRGDQVAFTWRSDAGAAAEVAGAMGFQGDGADEAHAAAVIGSLVESWGGVDVLVNAIGPTRVLPIALLDGADWDELNRSIARSTFVFSRAALRPMIRARSGRILNIGSFAVQRIVDGPVHYAAAKGAVVAFTRSLAREVGRYGITVNCLSPGLMNGGISAGLPAHRVEEFRSQCALGRLGDPAELAEIALFMLDTPFMTGVNLVADGGL